VARILLHDGSTTGVVYIHDGQKYTVTVRREVVVCGGTIASPQILELSGIGDRQILETAGVECLVDLPAVGQNLMDHQDVATVHRLVEGAMSGDVIWRPEVMQMAQQALMAEGGGPLTNVAAVQGFFPAKMFLEDGELEEIIKLTDETGVESEFRRQQLNHFLEHVKSDDSASIQFILLPVHCDPKGIPDQTKLFVKPEDPNGPNHFTLAACLMYGASRGSVHIKSSDPLQHPDIDLGYLSHPADATLLSAGYKFLDKLAHSPGLEKSIEARTFPGPEIDLTDPKARRDWVKEFIMVRLIPCFGQRTLVIARTHLSAPQIDR
jgi:choline dehydrogenase-like flavoprotein